MNSEQSKAATAKPMMIRVDFACNSLERLDSMISAISGKRLTYAGLTA